MTNSLERIQKMNAEMQKLEKDKIFLENFLQKIAEISKRQKNLETYYYEKWLSDKENHENEMYSILSEDGLYNLFFEIENAKKGIIKFLVAEL